MTSEDTNWRKVEKSKEFDFEEVDEEDFNCILPSSPNWYCNSILDCLNGHAAFGGKNALFVFDMKTMPPICNWSMNGATFSLRITAVALMNVAVDDYSNDSVDHIAFSSDDGLLKIVNLKEKRIIKDLKKHLVIFCH